MELPELVLPEWLNYVGVFLTLECNLNCMYCINDPEQLGRRSALFPMMAKSERKALTPAEWAVGLNRIPFSPDLPITLQGGEPMLYWSGKGLGLLLGETPHYYDLLTNFAVRPEIFSRNLNGQHKKLQRNAPYPSIRVSYHADEMNRTWEGRGFAELVDRCEALKDHGFQVSASKAESDVGIYMVEHPDNVITDEMRAAYAGRVPFEGKEFLGVHEGKLYGHYRYPFSTDLISRGFSQNTLQCECKTSELLLDPMGFAWSCHYYLYSGWSKGGPVSQFLELRNADFRFNDHADRLFPKDEIGPIGHILDPSFRLADLDVFRSCSEYGRCIGCDTKIKNNRFQNYFDHGVAHTSVTIRNIQMPPELESRIEESYPPADYKHRVLEFAGE